MIEVDNFFPLDMLETAVTGQSIPPTGARGINWSRAII